MCIKEDNGEDMHLSLEFMAIGVVRAWHGTFHAILFPKKYGLIPKKPIYAENYTL